MNQVVARFIDGKLLKGVTGDFSPAKDTFHVAPADGARPVEVRTASLKALFFVKDLAGNPSHLERGAFDPRVPTPGRRIMVTFQDGEHLVGATQGYQAGRPGFFMVPADHDSNIERCYVIAASTAKVAFL
jgi:hypothetical protein